MQHIPLTGSGRGKDAEDPWAVVRSVQVKGARLLAIEAQRARQRHHALLWFGAHRDASAPTVHLKMTPRLVCSVCKQCQMFQANGEKTGTF